jgi:chemotaxis protein methyltransferase CheR
MIRTGQRRPSPVNYYGSIPPLSDVEFQRYESFIYNLTGIHLGPSRRALVMGRLARRILALNLSTFGDYFERVTSGDETELTMMLDCLLTNKTEFFRENRHFEFLKKRVFPEWIRDCEARRRPRRIRAWSAACSTGEEAYSLAMLLVDHFPASHGWSIEILATDLSSRAIQGAQAATWPIDGSTNIPPHYLTRFMLKGKGSRDGYMKADRQLRSIINCRRLNLNDSDFGDIGNFDLIFCRNVLLYFDAVSRRRAVSQLLIHLVRNGYLFLGHAETLDDSFEGMRRVTPSVYTFQQNSL